MQTRPWLKKINSLRSNVRKKQKKIDSSMKSGASADNVYKPSLWYFELFDFIKDQDNPRSSVSNLSPERDNDEVNIDDPSPEENQLTPTVSQEERRESNLPAASAGISRPGPSIKRKSNDGISAEILSTVRDHFKRPQPQIDCCELLGRTVAIKMRGLKDKRLHIHFHKCTKLRTISHTKSTTLHTISHTKSTTLHTIYHTKSTTLHTISHTKNKTQLLTTIQKQHQVFCQISLKLLNE
ncbi:unnamed protein product [Acanthoscelides obtectus]|uniref:Uncharacterized protein n=1 Tax=Acanthoscelides obtectus TaxID=200917 RepID=A0A9P0KBC0_ACAOB|nr:unnamed protein product [Acanthoscelides obtectus]CAK1653219.1 hypothetical protein AOBTE_LOCUS18133 [Acanthoscelides obtectus]